MHALRFAEDEGFPASSRFFSGHFPGDPVVPGAVIMGYLAARLGEHGFSLNRIERMKFIRPILPAVPIETLVEERESTARLEIRDRKGVLVRGRLRLAPRR